MDDLAAFLNARLSEEHFFSYKFVHTDGGEWTADEMARLWWYGDPPKSRSALDPIIQHVAYYNPARTLREVEAKRAILDAYVRADGDSPRDRDRGRRDALDAAVRRLAAVYSDHPDYRDERKPPTG